MSREVPFCFDPRREDYKVGLAIAKLRINETRTIVCDAVCPGCEDYIGKYPIKSAPEEDGYWRVRCMNCNSIFYEELMEDNHSSVTTPESTMRTAKGESPVREARDEGANEAIERIYAQLWNSPAKDVLAKDCPGKKDYDLICQICLDMFNKVGADIKVGEHVIGGRCWRCLTNDSEGNPVYRLSLTKVNDGAN